MKSLLALLLFVHSFAFAGAKIVLTGSSTVAPLMDELAKSFEKKTHIRVDVQTGGSTRGIIDARRGSADIGMVSRGLRPTEKDLTQFTIALDGIGLIIHKSNPISDLSTQEIQSIFLGKVTNWKELGGPDKRIVVVNKAQGRSTLELFLKHFKLKSSHVKSHIIIGDNEQGIKTISVHPWAIGYVSIGTAHYNVINKTPIKLLRLNGITASVENVKKGIYPLSRELNLVTYKSPDGVVKDFIEYSRSQSDVIRRQYFVPTK